MKRGLLLLAACVVCLAQTAAPPAAISAYYRLGNQAAGPYPYKWLIVDPPLTLTVDAAGSPHLGIQGAWFPLTITNELPQPVAPVAPAAVSVWTLVNVPLGGTTNCTRNGLAQQLGVDYTLLPAGQLTSTFWVADDTLICSYQTAALFPLIPNAAPPPAPSTSAVTAAAPAVKP